MTLIALLMACQDFELPAGNFEVPRAAAVLQPELGGPFQEPVGFVANELGGQVVLLALKQGRLLTDDRTASFLPANQLATGDRRLLSSIAVYAPSREEVTVFVGDRAFGQLLTLPYLVPCPESEVGPCEGSRAGVSAPDGVVAGTKLGWTTTETWTLTARDGEWIAEGSRSGLQPNPVIPSRLPWSAEDRRLQLFAVPEAVDGQTLTIETNSGLRELDLPGVPLDLVMAPDQSVLAMIVQDPDTLQSRLRWIDPAGPRTIGTVPLPAGAEPHRLAHSEDGVLLVADAARPAFYEVPFGGSAVVEHVMPWPTLDVAGPVLVDEETQAESPVRFVVPIDGDSLWRYDPVAEELLDVNPAEPGAQGMEFDVPVQGIEGMPFPFRSSQLDEDEERVDTRAVSVALSDGRVLFAHEDTGCLVQDRDGPETALVQRSGSTSTDIDSSEIPVSAEFASRFALPYDGEPNRVTVNSCAGIAKPETWAVTFDQTLGTWEVEGSLSGPQTARVVEDRRYVTDDGAVSFLLRSGSTPSLDGWVFSFSVDAGLGAATGDGNADGLRETDLSGAGDPVFFYYRVGEVGPVTQEDLEMRQDGQEDWSFNSNIRPFVLVPGGATNRVGRVDPSDVRFPVVEVSWE